MKVIVKLSLPTPNDDLNLIGEINYLLQKIDAAENEILKAKHGISDLIKKNQEIVESIE